MESYILQKMFGLYFTHVIVVTNKKTIPALVLYSRENRVKENDNGWNKEWIKWGRQMKWEGPTETNN